MSEPRRAPTVAPWIVAAVAGVVTVALLVTFLVVLVPYRRDHAPGRFTSREKDAMAAASIESANTLSYRLKQFDADFARALAGTTGDVRDELQGDKSATLQAMTAGKYDLAAKVTHVALQGTSGKGYAVLVTMDAGPTVAGAQQQQPTWQVDLVPTKAKVKWLISKITVIGLSG
jgi:hypothetical protein